MSAITTLDRYRRLPTEAAMISAIQDVVRARQGRLWHVHDARNAPELTDLPDLVVIVPLPSGGTLAALVELKSSRRTMTPGQQRVADLLATVTQFWGGVVRPEPKHDAEMAYDDFLTMLGVDS